MKQYELNNLRYHATYGSQQSKGGGCGVLPLVLGFVVIVLMVGGLVAQIMIH